MSKVTPAVAGAEVSAIPMTLLADDVTAPDALVLGEIGSPTLIALMPSVITVTRLPRRATRALDDAPTVS